MDAQPEFSMPQGEAFALLLTRDGLPADAVIERRRGTELEVHRGDLERVGFRREGDRYLLDLGA